MMPSTTIVPIPRPPLPPIGMPKPPPPPPNPPPPPSRSSSMLSLRRKSSQRIARLLLHTRVPKQDTAESSTQSADENRYSDQRHSLMWPPRHYLPSRSRDQ